MQENSNTKNFIRGGQVVLHNIRMFNQIIIRVFLVALLIFVMINAGWFFVRTTPYQRYVVSEWVLAKTKVVLNDKAKQSFTQPDGEIYEVYSKDVLSSHKVANVIYLAKDILFEGCFIGIFLYFLVFAALWRWLRKRGKKASEPKRLRGDYLASSLEVKKVAEKAENKNKRSKKNERQEKNENKTFLFGSKTSKIDSIIDNFRKLMGVLGVNHKEKNNRPLSLVISEDEIPIPELSVKQHFLFHGSTGTGKSMTMKELLDQLRESGDSVFVYDKGCVLTEEYFDPNLDCLMNCLDERGVEWDLWTECRDLTEFEAFATAQIPMPPNTQDPFWVGASRTIFAQAANRMRKEVKKPRLLTLLQYLLTAELSEIKHLLSGTVAESLMSEKIEKTAISIKSVLATYLKSMCYVKEGENPFSIREWIEKPKPGQWLFISSRGDKHETLKPLITAWIDIAINTLLSLPENDNRRIWFILDEFTSLHQLPRITDGLSEGRKFGGCFMIGIQNISKLNDVYGVNGSKNISSLLNTRFMFRQPDPDVAAWSAKNLGETDFEEVNESISYGANTMRDGVSINRTEKRKPVVTYSEIMNLNDLECYLRLAGNYPISRIKVALNKREKINEAFIERVVEHDDLRVEVQEMIETLKSSGKIFKKESKKSKGNSGNEEEPKDSQDTSKQKSEKIQKIKQEDKKSKNKKNYTKEEAQEKIQLSEDEKESEQVGSESSGPNENERILGIDDGFWGS